MKISFQLTNQRNKLLEKGKIVHKVLELNLAVSIHAPCCAYYFLNRHRCQQDESTILIQCPAYLAKTINTDLFCLLKITKSNFTYVHYYSRLPQNFSLIYRAFEPKTRSGTFWGRLQALWVWTQVLSVSVSIADVCASWLPSLDGHGLRMTCSAFTWCS